MSKAKKPMDLSKREMQVLKLIADGLSDKEIADKLSVSIHTPGVHRTHIYQKLNVNSAVMAVRVALRAGWIKV